MPAPSAAWNFESTSSPQADTVGALSLSAASTSATNAGIFALAANKAGTPNKALQATQGAGGGYNYWRITCTGGSLGAAADAAVFPTAAITVEAMVRLNTLPVGTQSGNTTLVRRQNATSGFALYVNKDTGVAGFAINDKLVEGASALAANTWYHLVGTYDGANVRLYIDGVEVSASPVAQTGVLIAPTTSCDFKIGGEATSASGNTRNLTGIIDDVRIYGSALSAAQVGARFATY